MARLNIEEWFFSDPRYMALRNLVGCEDKAIGMAVRFWRLAQHYWVRQNQLIPKSVFALSGLDPIIQAGLGVENLDGIYACGSEKQFAWYKSRLKNASCGGKKSAKSAKARRSSSSWGQANAKQTQAYAQAKLSHASGPPNPLVPVLVPVPVLDPVLDKKTEDSEERRLPYQEFVDLWTKHHGEKRKVLRVTDSRRKKIAVRLKENPDLGYWDTVFGKMAKSSFCQNSSFATFDWAIENDTNHVKAAEGKYDDKFQKAEEVFVPREDGW